MRAVIGGIGYRDLRDHSFGPMVSDALAEGPLPPGVEAQDLSYNPVAVGQWLEAMAADERPQRMVLVSGIRRGREPGTHVVYRWDGTLPHPERIQNAVADAVTGVIHLDNTLVVLAQFGPMPEELIVIEVEPVIEEFGEDLSDGVAPLFQPLRDLALSLATDPTAVSRLPVCPLGGPGPSGPGGSRNGGSGGPNGSSGHDPDSGGPRIGPPFPRMVRRL